MYSFYQSCQHRTATLTSSGSLCDRNSMNPSPLFVNDFYLPSGDNSLFMSLPYNNSIDNYMNVAATQNQQHHPSLYFDLYTPLEDSTLMMVPPMDQHKQSDSNKSSDLYAKKSLSSLSPPAPTVLLPAQTDQAPSSSSILSNVHSPCAQLTDTPTGSAAISSVSAQNNVSSAWLVPGMMTPLSPFSVQSCALSPSPSYDGLFCLDEGDFYLHQDTPPPSSPVRVPKITQHTQKHCHRHHCYHSMTTKKAIKKENRGLTIIESLTPLTDSNSHHVRLKGNHKQQQQSQQQQQQQQQIGHFQCDYEGCGKVFGRKYNLSSHRITHSAERNYPCGDCSKTFVRRHDLKRHARVHTGETPHKCLYCFRGYGRADALQRHYNVTTECAIKLHNDLTNPLHLRRKRKAQSTGFGAKS